VKNWNELDLNFKTIANIDQAKCVNCGLCYVACEDTSHQSVRKIAGLARRDPIRYEIIEEECVGCNLCALVCPVDAIAMIDQKRDLPYLPWTKHPNNPMAGR
jgi:dihydropyrimidine dehydrogenase (NAD+) subunit PreA